MKAWLPSRMADQMYSRTCAPVVGSSKRFRNSSTNCNQSMRPAYDNRDTAIYGTCLNDQVLHDPKLLSAVARRQGNSLHSSFYPGFCQHAGLLAQIAELTQQSH